MTSLEDGLLRVRLRLKRSAGEAWILPLAGVLLVLVGITLITDVRWLRGFPSDELRSIWFGGKSLVFDVAAWFSRTEGGYFARPFAGN